MKLQLLTSDTVHYCKIKSIMSYDFRSLKTRVKILVDGTLLIPNLIPEDAGNYTCIPTNGILTPPSASAYLTVKRKALICTLHCFVNSGQSS